MDDGPSKNRSGPENGPSTVDTDWQAHPRREYLTPTVVLCDLGGLTHEAAARQLRCPVGTIESRLSRGRGLLRARLIRRGLTPAAAWASGGEIVVGRRTGRVVALTIKEVAIQLSAGKTAPAGLVSASVTNLVKGAHTTMVVSRLKLAAVFLVATGVLGTGAGVLVGQERKDVRGNVAVGVDSPLTNTEEPSERIEPKPADKAPFLAALEQRLDALERRLDELHGTDRVRNQGDRPPSNPFARFDPDSIRKIRPRFDCLVEKIHVKVGQR